MMIRRSSKVNTRSLDTLANEFIEARIADIKLVKHHHTSIASPHMSTIMCKERT